MIKRQFFRFVVIGLASNGALYLLYLLLTRGALDPRAAMTLTYAMGIAVGFVGNRHWSFKHAGQPGRAFARYVIIYAVGYVINFCTLEIGVHLLGFPHEVVQLLTIVFLALFFFFLQKFYVFPEQNKTEALP